MSARQRFISVEQARKLDQRARERFGVPEQILMENAGRQVAEIILRLRRVRCPAIVCGRGNNGADGLVAARHLLVRGIYPRVFLAGDPRRLTGLPQMQRTILRKLGCRIEPITPGTIGRLRRGLRGCDCVIDALFGTGLSREVAGTDRAVIEAVNSAGAFVLAVDVPSGLNADTGGVRGACVKADATVTFVAPKPGMRPGKAKRLCGRIIVADIGVPLLKA